MSSAPDDLWPEVYQAFPYPRDRVQSEINRIAMKCLKQAGVVPDVEVFDASTCDVTKVLVARSELAKLVRYHDRTTPTDRTSPIVIVRAGGTDVVVEGNNRVNKWVAEDSGTSSPALVITLRDRTPTG
jgi:hypothetical protein